MKDFRFFSMTIVYWGSNLEKYWSHRIKFKGGRTTGLTELTVNSCFSALSLFSSFYFLSCVPPHLSFLLFSLKKFPEKEWHFKYFIYLCTRIPILLTPSWCFLSQKERLLRRGLGRVVVSWHNIERLLGALFLTDWNFANFMNSHEQCNGRCPRDVFSHIPLLIWLIASSDKSYIRIGESVHISAWASTLLVQLFRAMRRPQFVGRVTRRSHAFRLF